MSTGNATANTLSTPPQSRELSPWVFVFMAALFLVTALAGFLVRAGRFQAQTTHFNDDHIYEYPGALRHGSGQQS